ncbi:YciI family protein [Devosia lacusdianchii]|uniref:YciI family protein n=1 Tax=Devosia lacusdianchii TaxID=2917991 RepID=UPI001F06387C|nr:YciI family protein [Devosia sp. JXJ CY 41]
MNYLCIIYAQDGGPALSPEQGTAIGDGCIEQDHALFLAGKLVMASPLQNPRTAVSMRYSNGVASRTDGPYVETKEFIAGFMVIVANDIEEAIRIAAEGPLEGIANFEIRPLLDEKHSKTGQDRSFFFQRD